MADYKQNVDLTNTDLPRRISLLRENRCLAKGDLADRAGLSVRTVHDLERGRRTRIQEHTLMALAEALEIPVSELLGRELNDNNTNSAPMRTKERRSVLTRQTGLLLLAGLVLVLTITGGVLWSYARSNTEWVLNPDKTLTVYDGVFGTRIWGLEGENRIHQCRLSPWRNDRLIVATGGKTDIGGLLLNLNRATGDTIWAIRPDIEAAVRAFGPEDVSAANFGCLDFYTAELDGAGVPELVVYWRHEMYYPALLTAVSERGVLKCQYANRGHILDIVITDLDQDGKNEVLAAGTNNVPAYQGGTVFILDNEHWSGASIDSEGNPESTETDSARVRLVLPQFPEPYMELLGANRLHARQIKLQRDSEGVPLITVRLSSAPSVDPQMIVFMDKDLRPLACETTDMMRSDFLPNWPDSLTEGTGPGDSIWCAQWLATHRRFEAGHWSPKQSVSN